MKKGIFSGLIAVTAIMLIGVIMLTSSANIKNSGSENIAQGIWEIKKEWNNARYLLDKATTDALADSANTGPCTFALDAAKVQHYYMDTIAHIPGCTQAFTVAATAQAGNYQATGTITCSKKISNDFSIKKFEKPAVFTKTVSVQKDMPAAGDCTVIITDAQSGLVEISRVV
ncbi:MAG: hypothetical protein PHH08_04875 [Candidatus ainarchaeum sp.]|nr:hypothetical protein [Candidatus ainarchaeum sp.]